MGSAGPDWEAGGGVHTRRGVHGVLGLTIGSVCGEPAQLHSSPVMAVALIGQKGGRCTHSQGSARRPCADHDGCQLICGEPAQLHSTSVMAVAQIGKRGDGVHTRRGVHGVLVLTMMGVSVDVW